MTGTQPKIKLVYFDMEGFAEPVRLALTLTGLEFEDERLTWSQWIEFKPKTPYGNLPVMYINEDENPKTQSGAMLRYVASLRPEKKLNPTEKLYAVEEAIGLVEDLNRAWWPNMIMGGNPAFYGHPQNFGTTEAGKETIKNMRTKFAEQCIPAFARHIADFVDKHGNGKFMCGDTPTIADCMAVPALGNFTKGNIQHVAPDCLKCEPRIVAYLERFLALPEIQARYGVVED